MTSKTYGAFAIACILLLTVGTSGAYGHEAHRKAAAEAAAKAAAEAAAPVKAAAPADSEPAEQPAETVGVEEPAAESHSHSAHQSDEGTDAQTESVSFFSWLGRFHPMTVHFPIALFMAALVAELLYMTTRQELFRHALRFSLWGGAMSAAVAAPLGWMFAASGATEEGWLLDAHRWAGTVALVLGAGVLWIGERTERGDGNRLVLRVALALQASLVGGVGFLGGSLLYGFDHLWRGLF